MNLSKVAEQLNMAQSTISKKLKNLETELSITLVERNKGTKTLCYKNPYYFATYKGLQEPENGRPAHGD